MEKMLFEELLNIMQKLRSEEGCPWDREQTVESLKPSLIEECYEVIEAIEEDDPQKIQEELGDLLFQIVFLAQIGKEEGKFDIKKIISSVSDKMIRRHPHVFSEDTASDASEVLMKWENIKREEAKKDTNDKDGSILDGLPRGLPAIIYAHRLQDKASRVGFDWHNLKDILDKLDEEVGEFKDALKEDDKTKCELELGDLLFTIINIARFIRIEPEGALRKSISKFSSRFRMMEKIISERGEKFKNLNLEELDRYWEYSKKLLDKC